MTNREPRTTDGAKPAVPSILLRLTDDDVAALVGAGVFNNEPDPLREYIRTAKILATPHSVFLLFVRAVELESLAAVARSEARRAWYEHDARVLRALRGRMLRELRSCGFALASIAEAPEVPAEMPAKMPSGKENDRA